MTLQNFKDSIRNIIDYSQLQNMVIENNFITNQTVDIKNCEDYSNDILKLIQIHSKFAFSGTPLQKATLENDLKINYTTNVQYVLLLSTVTRYRDGMLNFNNTDYNLETFLSTVYFTPTLKMFDYIVKRIEFYNFALSKCISGYKPNTKITKNLQEILEENKFQIKEAKNNSTVIKKDPNMIVNQPQPPMQQLQPLQQSIQQQQQPQQPMQQQPLQQFIQQQPFQQQQQAQQPKKNTPVSSLTPPNAKKSKTTNP
jgi:hypothetical protein